MARVTFTHTIQRHVPCPPAEADGRTVREVLERVFAANPAAREYVLDDQGAARGSLRSSAGRAGPARGGASRGRTSWATTPPWSCPIQRDRWVYVALGHGHFGVKMHRSPDGGRTWEPCATPAYPPRPEGADDVEPNSGRPIPWNTELVWALETGHRLAGTGRER